MFASWFIYFKLNREKSPNLTVINLAMLLKIINRLNVARKVLYEGRLKINSALKEIHL